MQLIAPAVALAALAAGAHAQSTSGNLTVTTPTSLVECQPAQFTVSGGTAPYFLSIIPGGQAGSAPLETLPDQATAGSVTWTVDIASGTAITVQVRDSAGTLNYSQQVTIQAGTSTSCVGKNSASSGGASSAAASASGAASSAQSQASSVAGSASSAAKSAGSSAAPSATASGSSDATKVAATGFLGFAGVVFAALFA